MVAVEDRVWYMVCCWSGATADAAAAAGAVTVGTAMPLLWPGWIQNATYLRYNIAEHDNSWWHWQSVVTCPVPPSAAAVCSPLSDSLDIGHILLENYDVLTSKWCACTSSQ